MKAMRCPRCGFEGELVGGGCARCGYGRVRVPSDSSSLMIGFSSSLTSRSSATSTTSKPLVMSTLTRGDVLHQGRYRLLDQMVLPANQQRQGTAWLATDTQSGNRRVVIREVIPPVGASSNKEQVVRSIALRLAELGQHPGFPSVLDTFSEQDSYYIVLRHIEGDSLATLIRRQGGALSERTVAEYGLQLCEMLSLLSRQQPPLVHGAISPETIIVSPDRSRVSLIHLPLFPPKGTPTDRDKAIPGYTAPEQARSGVVEPSSDLYALAATLHHAVTGYDPRERMAFFHPPARRLNPVVTPHMEAILSQALRLSTSQRYARPADMQQDLAALIASYPAVTAPSVAEEALNPVTNALRLSSAQMRQRSRNRSLLNTSIFGGVGVLALLVFLLVYLHPAFPSFSIASTNIALQNATATSVAQQNALKAELALELQTFQKKGIGISDGRLVFDTFTGRMDVDLKKRAGQALQQNDTSRAVNLLTQAVTADPTDGEAQIYNEDLHLLQSGAPYVTIVLGLPIDNSAADINFVRADMRAAFLAQHEVNVEGGLPHGLKLRILIDSSGANDDDVATVAQFIANRVSRAGNLDHIIGVVGWPFSSQTTDARDVVAAVHLPLVSQTASSVKLSGSSPYFFRVNPSDDLQGNTLAGFAVQQLHARTILVLRDPTDTYSVSLADAFTARVKALGATPISTDTFSESTTTVEQYQQKVVVDAIRNKVDIIFLAGLDVDAVRLTNAVGNLYRANPRNLTLANLKIMGGDAIDTDLLLGQGGNADATIAAKFPQDMRRLIFSSFADPAEWNGVPQKQWPVFFTDWVHTYQSSSIATNNAPDPTYDPILTYDAVRVIIDAATFLQGTLTGQAIRDALASLGKGKVPAFQGVSGRILFDDKGNPIDKAIVVLDVESSDSVNVIRLKQVAGTFMV